VDLHVAVVGIGLARQQAFQLLFGRAGAQALELQFGLADGGLVVLAFAQLEQHQRVVQFLAEICKGRDRVVQRAPLAHHRLRGLRIVPQIRVLGLLVQFLEALLRALRVKDASLAGSTPP
jgi:hypothetical protein